MLSCPQKRFAQAPDESFQVGVSAKPTFHSEYLECIFSARGVLICQWALSSDTGAPFLSVSCSWESVQVGRCWLLVAEAGREGLALLGGGRLEWPVGLAPSLR